MANRYGNEWKRLRQLTQSYTNKPKEVTGYLGQMDQVAQDAVER